MHRIMLRPAPPPHPHGHSCRHSTNHRGPTTPPACRYGRASNFLLKANLRNLWTLQKRGIAFYIIRM